MLNEDGQCFTRVPNVLLDQAMQHMGYAELKIVFAVLRQTVGWHKPHDVISLSQFEEMTGMTRANVIKGIRDAAAHQWIKHYKRGNVSVYEPSLDAGIAAIPGDASIAAIPEMVLQQYPPSIAAIPEMVSQQYTQKKGKKTTKERKEISSDASVEANQTQKIEVSNSHDEQQIPENANVESITAAPAEKKSKRPERARKTKLSEHEEQRQKEIFYALAQICVLDTKLKAGAIVKAATQLRIAHAEASGADLVAFLDWWKTSDWRGQKGQPPTLHDVFDSWGKFRQGYATMSPPRASERNTISIEKINASLDF